MKKNFAVMCILFILVGGTYSLEAMIPGISDDYKVIKKGKKRGEPKYFRVVITENSKSKVKVTLPLVLVETLFDNLGDLDIDCKNRRNINFKKIYKSLKKYGPLTIIEIEDGDENIKVWLE